MHIDIRLLGELASAGLTGGTMWMVYAAIWKHAPAKFPRTVDEWWAWFRGSNQEIASQHSGNASNIIANPITPANPATKEGK